MQYHLIFVYYRTYW